MPVLGAIAAAVAIVVVVPTGTAGAAPAPKMSMTTGPASVSVSDDGQSVLVNLSEGMFRKSASGDALLLVDSRGAERKRLPLLADLGDQVVRIAPTLSADSRSVRMVPVAERTQPQTNQPSGHDKKSPQNKPRKLNANQAWDEMWKQLKADWPCASHYAATGSLIGALIGALVGSLFFIFGAIYGALIGAYYGVSIGVQVGYQTCNKGAGYKAIGNWQQALLRGSVTVK